MDSASSRKFTVAGLNDLPAAGFVAAIGPVFEHSPWIAEKAAEMRPFADAGGLLDALVTVMRESGPEQQLALIGAHPDLAGRLAQQGLLTPESTREQASAGLGTAPAETLGHLRALGDAYREKFGFPFIICARLNDTDSILRALGGRLGNGRDAEIINSLAEIEKIAALRLDDLLE